MAVQACGRAVSDTKQQTGMRAQAWDTGMLRFAVSARLEERESGGFDWHEKVGFGNDELGSARAVGNGFEPYNQGYSRRCP